MRMKPTLKHLLSAFSAALLLTNPVLAADERKPLSKTELNSVLSGNTLAGNGKGKVPAEPYDWIAYYDPDGTMTMRLKPAWGGIEFVGRWWLTEDNQWCRKFKNRQKKEGCWHMYREPKSLRFVPSSGVAVEGNAVMLTGDQLQLVPKK